MEKYIVQYSMKAIILCVVVVDVAFGGPAVASFEFPWVKHILLHRACKA